MTDKRYEVVVDRRDLFDSLCSAYGSGLVDGACGDGEPTIGEMLDASHAYANARMREWKGCWKAHGVVARVWQWLTDA